MTYGRNTIPENCKQWVHGPSGWGMDQCSRKHKIDGYCKQHHPDAVRQRLFESNARWRAKRARQKEQLHKQCNKRIADLEKRVQELESEVSGLEYEVQEVGELADLSDCFCDNED